MFGRQGKKDGYRPIVNQLRRFEKGGLLRREKQGKTVLYSFDQSSPFFKPLFDLIGTLYNRLTLEEKREVFSSEFKRERK